MKRGLLGPLVAITLGFVVLIGLGTWQMQRLAWKEGLLATIEARMAETALPLAPRAEWATYSQGVDDYRRVTVTGRFDHAGEAHVFFPLTGARGPFSGPGYLVITPFLVEGGGTILVNRGFVPQDRRDPASRAEGNASGTTTLIGLMRWSEPRGWFTPDDDPARNLWYVRDIGAIAKDRGLTDAAPFSLDVETSGSGGLPQGGETRVNLSNRHLGYALTWYGLAAALLAVGGVFIRRRAMDDGMALETRAAP